jgi:hypothetical protein
VRPLLLLAFAVRGREDFDFLEKQMMSWLCEVTSEYQILAQI